MKIWRITYCARELPLCKPVFNVEGPITSRRVVYLAIHGENGLVGIGEAAPLPEFGTESVEDVLEAMKYLGVRPEYPDLHGSPQDIEDWIVKVGVPSSGMRVLVFALQCALLTLRLRHDHATPGEYFRHSVVDSVRVNALISGANAEQILQAAEAAVQAGFGTLKVKVGMNRVEEDIELINELRRRFPSIKLRVDANCAWSFDEAVRFLTGVYSAHLEYVEDPLFDPDSHSLHRLSTLQLVPVALDFTIGYPIPLGKAITSQVCRILVLKPSVMGSWLWMAQTADRATANGKSVVISSLLESEIALSYLVHCATLFGSGAYAHGLATGSYLMGGSLTPSLHIYDGKIEIPPLCDLHKRIPSSLQGDLEILSL